VHSCGQALAKDGWIPFLPALLTMWDHFAWLLLLVPISHISPCSALNSCGRDDKVLVPGPMLSPPSSTARPFLLPRPARQSCDQAKALLGMVEIDLLLLLYIVWRLDHSRLSADAFCLIITWSPSILCMYTFKITFTRRTQTWRP
jgi:hypothetical protein